MKNLFKNELKIAPSILSADFTILESEVRQLEKGGADLIHIDVMDGHFVPNITFGPLLVKAIKSLTNVPLDVHLMISNPDVYLEDFRKAGADIISVHQETCPQLHRTVKKIRKLGAHVGVSINPTTSISTIERIIKEIDLVLIMSVNPGFGGQKFIETSLSKIHDTYELLQKKNPKVQLEVDGGIDTSNIKAVVDAGCNIVVAGTGIFSNADRVEGVKNLRNAATH